MTTNKDLEEIMNRKLAEQDARLARMEHLLERTTSLLESQFVTPPPPPPPPPPPNRYDLRNEVHILDPVTPPPPPNRDDLRNEVPIVDLGSVLQQSSRGPTIEELQNGDGMDYIPQQSTSNRDPTTEELENGDGIDYMIHFDKTRRFTTFEEGFDYANNIALNMGFNLIKERYKANDVNFVACERYGRYRSKATIRKNTTSKKCGCRFEIVFRKSKDGKWIMSPKVGYHNHLLGLPEGHRRLAKLSEEQKEFIRGQKISGVSPKDIKAGLKIKFPHRAQPNIRQIYSEINNIKAKSRRDINMVV